MMPVRVLGVDVDSRAGRVEILVPAGDRAVARGRDELDDVRDAGVDGRGVGGGGAEGGGEGAEEDVGVGAGDAVEVLVFGLAGCGGGGRGLGGGGVEVALVGAWSEYVCMDGWMDGWMDWILKMGGWVDVTHYPATTFGAFVHLRWWLLPLSVRSGDTRVQRALWRRKKHARNL